MSTPFKERIEQSWRRWCHAIGVMFIVLWLLGALNVIDFHICIKGPGECPW